MRSVVQRVDRANVRVGGECISSINKGMLVFIGIGKGDRLSDADYLAEKIMHLRIFEDQEKKMNLSLLDIKGEMLVVSQFTLMGDCRKGRRPSFTKAENPELAKLLYDYFINRAREQVSYVAEGKFQTMMSIESINNGPITVLMDSRRGF
jgi:D-tyrosyl-tRNA(Tyr) deacylase